MHGANLIELADQFRVTSRACTRMAGASEVVVARRPRREWFASSDQRGVAQSGSRTVLFSGTCRSRTCLLLGVHRVAEGLAPTSQMTFQLRKTEDSKPAPNCGSRTRTDGLRGMNPAICHLIYPATHHIKAAGIEPAISRFRRERDTTSLHPVLDKGPLGVEPSSCR